MVECLLAKEKVSGSSPLRRSHDIKNKTIISFKQRPSTFWFTCRYWRICWYGSCGDPIAFCSYNCIYRIWTRDCCIYYRKHCCSEQSIKILPGGVVVTRLPLEQKFLGPIPSPAAYTTTTCFVL